MNILIINPIIYTSETKIIKKAQTIKDTMIYDLCLAFYQEGHNVTLYAGLPFKPDNDESYPFDVLWGECKMQSIFLPHCLPYMPEIKNYIKQNKDRFDLIISSEIFSVNTYMAYKAAPSKLIAWHELAKHNAIFKQLPSKIWYGIVAPHFMKNIRVVARSNEAKGFISQFCKNTEKTIIDHGVNLDLFLPSESKENTFVVCSQLIERKRIDGIIKNFSDFVSNGNDDYKLYIIGEGDKEQELKSLSSKLNMDTNIIFTGKLSHQELMPILASSKALLVNTIKDNNMISIVESIAVGTPILTTDVPLNAAYIKANRLGIAKNNWDSNDIEDIVNNNEEYTANCLDYRQELSTKKRVNQFINLI